MNLRSLLILSRRPKDVSYSAVARGQIKDFESQGQIALLFKPFLILLYNSERQSYHVEQGVLVLPQRNACLSQVLSVKTSGRGIGSILNEHSNQGWMTWDMIWPELARDVQSRKIHGCRVRDTCRGPQA